MGATPLRDSAASDAAAASSARRHGLAALSAPTTWAGRDVGRVVLLVLGDALAFLVFAGVGRESHGEASGLGALVQVAQTAAPFALGWFLVAPLAGAYRRAATASPGAALRRTTLAWLAAWPATLALRWVFSGQVPPLSFALVILVANTVFLNIWRAAYTLGARWLGRGRNTV